MVEEFTATDNLGDVYKAKFGSSDQWAASLPPGVSNGAITLDKKVPGDRGSLVLTFSTPFVPGADLGSNITVSGVPVPKPAG